MAKKKTFFQSLFEGIDKICFVLGKIFYSFTEIYLNLLLTLLGLLLYAELSQLAIPKIVLVLIQQVGSANMSCLEFLLQLARFWKCYLLISLGIKVMPTDFFSQLRAELFKKTGESGTWCLGIGVGAYILSKEYLIIHEEVCVIHEYFYNLAETIFIAKFLIQITIHCSRFRLSLQQCCCQPWLGCIRKLGQPLVRC